MTNTFQQLFVLCKLICLHFWFFVNLFVHSFNHKNHPKTHAKILSTVYIIDVATNIIVASNFMFILLYNAFMFVFVFIYLLCFSLLFLYSVSYESPKTFFLAVESFLKIILTPTLSFSLICLSELS